MIRKAQIVLEIVYNDEQCDHPAKWDWCDLTGEIAICMDGKDLEPTSEDIEQMS